MNKLLPILLVILILLEIFSGVLKGETTGVCEFLYKDNPTWTYIFFICFTGYIFLKIYWLFPRYTGNEGWIFTIIIAGILILITGSNEIVYETFCSGTERSPTGLGEEPNRYNRYF
tara:strand:- start:84 stop:431 length:348 start_codon:yes stop_codon:yes gene_type:complete